MDMGDDRRRGGCELADAPPADADDAGDDTTGDRERESPLVFIMANLGKLKKTIKTKCNHTSPTNLVHLAPANQRAPASFFPVQKIIQQCR